MAATTLNRVQLGASDETRAVLRASEPSTLRQTLSLDGPWQFRAGAIDGSRTTHVPGCWESQFPDLRGWAGSAIYERTFSVPDSFRGRRVLLHFDAVDYYTEVWINGNEVGKHEGGYTPFAFDVAPHLRWDEENTVTVRVTDCTPDCDVPLPDGSGTLSFAEIPHGKQSWYTPVSGIWQSVWLEARSFVSIERLSVTPDVRDGTARVCVILSAAAAKSVGWTVQLAFAPPDGAGEVADVFLPIPEGSVSVEAAVPVPDALLWSPDHPNLYSLVATLRQGDELNDAFHTRFGMRWIETREGHIYLNGEPFFLIGALDQAFYPKTIYTAPSDDYLRDQFRKAKEMGLNTMRCHIKVPSTRYLDFCDEIGLLVWYEVPNGMILSEAMRKRVKQTFEEMLIRDGNHPCIMIKTIMNESWGIDLGDSEQREWLIETYQWAKKTAPDKLIVDNSACIPNFHVISDLDDYHVYYNVPDQAGEFVEWVRSFADRESGSYSGFGDASRMKTEPLLISEFGNWGLPNYDNVIAAEGGVPWWFNSGAGITQPAGVLSRFQKQKLGRAFRDYNALAEASQEQEWIALKFQIEEMRRRREVAGYVITEFTDINWEVNGLLDWGRNPKVFYDRLPALQQQDLLIPRPERYAYWSGETVRVDVEISKFSGRETDGGGVTWEFAGLNGWLPMGPTGRTDATALGTIEFVAPEVERPEKSDLTILAVDQKQDGFARTDHSIVIAPRSMQNWGAGKSVWIHDPIGVADGAAERFEAAGFRVVEAPEADTLAVITYWDQFANQFIQGGGKGVLVALHPKSLQITSGLGMRLQERQMNNWWGDWCSSHAWFVPEAFPYLPDTQKFGFEYENVIPHRVLTGANPDAVLSGLFVGWLHNPTGYAVKLPVGKGRLLATTFDVLSDFHTDPVATMMLAGFVDKTLVA